MNNDLTHERVGESVTSHRPAVVIVAVVGECRDNLRMYGVLVPVDCDLSVVDGVVSGIVRDGDVHLRIERDGGERTTIGSVVIMLEAEQVANFVAHDRRKLIPKLYGGKPSRGNARAEHKGCVGRIAITDITLFCQSQILPPLSDLRTGTADVNGRILAR